MGESDSPYVESYELNDQPDQFGGIDALLTQVRVFVKGKEKKLWRECLSLAFSRVVLVSPAAWAVLDLEWLIGWRVQAENRADEMDGRRRSPGGGGRGEDKADKMSGPCVFQGTVLRPSDNAASAISLV